MDPSEKTWLFCLEAKWHGVGVGGGGTGRHPEVLVSVQMWTSRAEKLRRAVFYHWDWEVLMAALWIMSSLISLPLSSLFLYLPPSISTPLPFSLSSLSL